MLDCLDDAGMYGRVARKKPEQNITLNWAKERKDWIISNWYKVIWSDESKFNLFASDRRFYVRRVGEDFISECVDQTVKFGGGNVIMWGCITCDGVGPLVKVKGRMNSDDYIKTFLTLYCHLLHQWGLNCFIILLYH